MADPAPAQSRQVADAQSVATVLSWFSARTALRTDRHRGRDMAARVAQVMHRTGIRDARCYIRLVETDAAAEAELRDALTVQETYFYRDAGQCEVVARTILPRLAAERKGAPLRLCSVGCATGEEAYTLAMLAEDAGVQVSVLGVDLGPVAIARAQAGRYPPRAVRAMDDLRRRAFLRQEHGKFVVADRVRQRVRFAVLNLADSTWAPMPPAAFDLVVCRNVLVYLVPEAVAAVASGLSTALCQGGWLVLAPTDPWPPAATGLEAVRTPAGIAYRRPDPAEAAATARCLALQRPVALSSPASAPPGHHEAPARVAADAPGTLERAIALADAGRSRDALTALAHALDEHRCDPRLHLLLALIHLDIGDAAAARRAARAALFLDPRMPVAHLALAAAERSLGRPAAMARAARNGRRLLGAAPRGTRPALAERVLPARLRALASASGADYDAGSLPQAAP